MARIVYNPPPGWEAAPPGWIPPEDWQPPAHWPKLPQGWPLFVTDRRRRRSTLWILFFVGGALGYAGVLESMGRPLPWVSFGLLGAGPLAAAVSRLVRVKEPTPPSRWPWRPGPSVLGYRGEVDHELHAELPWMRGTGEDGGSAVDRPAH